MRLGLYSVYDCVAKEFSAPTLAKNDGVASRMFLNSISKLPNTSDLKLYQIGEFDVEDLINPLHAWKPAMEVPITSDEDKNG